MEQVRNERNELTSIGLCRFIRISNFLDVFRIKVQQIYSSVTSYPVNFFFLVTFDSTIRKVCNIVQ